MENYQFLPFRRDSNSKGGSKLVFVKNGLTAKRVKDIETKVSETTSLKHFTASLMTYVLQNFVHMD